MIRTDIFKIDGTLVQTEILKAPFYTRVTWQRAPDRVEEGEVIDALRQVVGRSPKEVAQYLIEQFRLIGAVEKQQQQLGLWAPCPVLVQIRLDITRDDEAPGKPNPDIYLLVAKQLAVALKSCQVIQDSPAGIQAALNGGMTCLAVTNVPVHAWGLFAPERMVKNTTNLACVALPLLKVNGSGVQPEVWKTS